MASAEDIGCKGTPMHLNLKKKYPICYPNDIVYMVNIPPPNLDGECLYAWLDAPQQYHQCCKQLYQSLFEMQNPGTFLGLRADITFLRVCVWVGGGGYQTFPIYIIHWNSYTATNIISIHTHILKICNSLTISICNENKTLVV